MINHHLSFLKEQSIAVERDELRVVWNGEEDTAKTKTRNRCIQALERL
jgi:hypothetical protein